MKPSNKSLTLMISLPCEIGAIFAFNFVPAANTTKNKNNNTQEGNENKKVKDFDLPACLEYQGMN